MPAILRRAEFEPWKAAKFSGRWISHHAGWLGAIVLAFYLGAGWQNGQATREAITSVQTQYQGKLDFHRQNEVVIAKTAKAALDACNRNLGAALMNAAPPQDLKGCPPTSPVIKAITAPPATK